MTSKAAAVVRILLGLVFFVYGLNGFLQIASGTSERAPGAPVEVTAH